MKKFNYILALIITTFIFSNCTEKTLYTGKIDNYNEDVFNLKNKNEVISNLGFPSYVDPIEKKYFYFSEKKLAKNFYNSKIIKRELIVFQFNADDSIIDIQNFNLNDQKKVEIVKDEITNEVIRTGLLEQIFGGVGKAPMQK